MSGPNTFPTSLITLSSLQDSRTPSLLDVRHLLHMLRGPDADVMRQIGFQLNESIDNIQQTLRSNSPSLQYLSIDSADIGVLNVGGQYGPGQLTVLGGPPSYAGAGWIGTDSTATPVAITSIVAGLVTTAAPHLLKVNAAVLIENTTDPNNAGYYVVATVPTGSTFTVTGGVAGGNSTGGDVQRQFQGGWLAQFACGGTDFANAPLQVDVDGLLSLSNAKITLSGASGTISIDPTTAPIEIRATAPSGTFVDIVPGQMSVQDGTTTDAAIYNQYGISVFDKFGVITINIGNNSVTGDAGMSLSDHTGTAKSVNISTAPFAVPLGVRGDSAAQSNSGGLLSLSTPSSPHGLRFGVDDLNYSWIESYDSLPLMINPGGGNVGIGGVSSLYALNVVGDLNISGAYLSGGTPGQSVTLTFLSGTPAVGQTSHTVTFSGGIETAHT